MWDNVRKMTEKELHRYVVDFLERGGGMKHDIPYDVYMRAISYQSEN